MSEQLQTLSDVIRQRLGLTPETLSVVANRAPAKLRPYLIKLAGGGDAVIELMLLPLLLRAVGITDEQIAISTAAPVDVVKPSLASRVKQMRTTAGLTQPLLAEKVGVAVKTLDQWESGRRSPSVALLAKLASALNTDLSAFADCDFDGDSEESE